MKLPSFGLFFQNLEHEASKFWFVLPKLGACSFQVLVCFSKTWSMKLPSFGLFFQNLKHEAAKFWFWLRLLNFIRFEQH